MLHVLRHRTYRHLFAAQVLSLIGTGLTTVALGLLAYELAGADAGAVLGTALALKMVAYVGVAPFAGALTSHLPRRTVLVPLDLCRAALVCLLPFVTEIWQVYALVFAFQSFSAAFTPAFQATIPDILPDEREYTNALSLSRLAYDLESLLSPMLAGALLTVISFHWLFVGTTLGFLASAALVVSVALPIARTVGGASFADRLTRGISIYLKTPRLRGLLALNLAIAAASSMAIVNTVVLVRETFGADNREVALFFAAYGAGSMIVATVLSRILDRVEARTAMLTGAGLLTALLLAGSLGPGYWVSLVLWAALGACGALVSTPSGLLLRRSSDPASRPAVFAAQFALSHACWLVTYPAVGWIGAEFSLSAAFLAMFVVALAGTALAFVLWPSADPLEVPHEHLSFDHDTPHVHDAHHTHVHEGWEGPEPHRHPHRHVAVRHVHAFAIDDHHTAWPTR